MHDGDDRRVRAQADLEEAQWRFRIQSHLVRQEVVASAKGETVLGIVTTSDGVLVCIGTDSGTLDPQRPVRNPTILSVDTLVEYVSALVEEVDQWTAGADTDQIAALQVALGSVPWGRLGPQGSLHAVADALTLVDALRGEVTGLSSPHARRHPLQLSECESSEQLRTSVAALVDALVGLHRK